MSEGDQVTKADATRARIHQLSKVEDFLVGALAYAKGLKCEAGVACLQAEVLREYGDELAGLTGDIQLETEKEKGTE